MFCIEADAAISTLENALAIVRRTGVDLQGMCVRPSKEGLEVWLQLVADADEPLTLCRMRLHNAVGILSIRELPEHGQLHGCWPLRNNEKARGRPAASTRAPVSVAPDARQTG